MSEHDGYDGHEHKFDLSDASVCIHCDMKKSTWKDITLAAIYGANPDGWMSDAPPQGLTLAHLDKVTAVMKANSADYVKFEIDAMAMMMQDGNPHTDIEAMKFKAEQDGNKLDVQYGPQTGVYSLTLSPKEMSGEHAILDCSGCETNSCSICSNVDMGTAQVVVCAVGKVGCALVHNGVPAKELCSMDDTDVVCSEGTTGCDQVHGTVQSPPTTGWKVGEYKGIPLDGELKSMHIGFAHGVPELTDAQKTEIVEAASVLKQKVMGESVMQSFFDNFNDGSSPNALKLREIDPLTDMLGGLPWTGEDER